MTASTVTETHIASRPNARCGVKEANVIHPA
jgi:hypothetical protein